MPSTPSCLQLPSPACSDEAIRSRVSALFDSAARAKNVVECVLTFIPLDLRPGKAIDAQLRNIWAGQAIDAQLRNMCAGQAVGMVRRHWKAEECDAVNEVDRSLRAFLRRVEKRQAQTIRIRGCVDRATKELGLEAASKVIAFDKIEDGRVADCGAVDFGEDAVRENGLRENGLRADKRDVLSDTREHGGAVPSMINPLQMETTINGEELSIIMSRRDHPGFRSLLHCMNERRASGRPSPFACRCS